MAVHTKIAPNRRWRYRTIYFSLFWVSISYLYVNALNTITYQFDDFVSLVREKINLEKYIAVTRNKEKEFRNKWNIFCLYKTVLCPFSSQLLYFDLFLFATYLFNNLLNSRKLIPYVV